MYPMSQKEFLEYLCEKFLKYQKILDLNSKLLEPKTKAEESRIDFISKLSDYFKKDTALDNKEVQVNSDLIYLKRPLSDKELLLFEKLRDYYLTTLINLSFNPVPLVFEQSMKEEKNIHIRVLRINRQLTGSSAKIA